MSGWPSSKSEQIALGRRKLFGLIGLEKRAMVHPQNAWKHPPSPLSPKLVQLDWIVQNTSADRPLQAQGNEDHTSIIATWHEGGPLGIVLASFPAEWRALTVSQKKGRNTSMAFWNERHEEVKNIATSGDDTLMLYQAFIDRPGGPQSVRHSRMVPRRNRPVSGCCLPGSGRLRSKALCHRPSRLVSVPCPIRRSKNSNRQDQRGKV